MSAPVRFTFQGELTPFHYVGSQIAGCHISQLLDEQASVPFQQLLLAPKGLVAESMTDHLPLPRMRHVIRPQNAWWIAMDIWSVESLSF